MINLLIYEFILLAILTFPKNIKEGEFYLTHENQNQTKIKFVRDETNIYKIEGAHKFLVYTNNEEKPDIIYGFVDNGIYNISTGVENNENGDNDNSFDLDIIQFQMKLDRDKIKQKRQVFKTVDKRDDVVIEYKKNSVIISLKKGKDVITISDRYFK